MLKITVKKKTAIKKLLRRHLNVPRICKADTTDHRHKIDNEYTEVETLKNFASRTFFLVKF